MGTQVLRKIHTWLAVTVSGFLLAWLSSGIVMIAPRLSAEPERSPYPDTIDVRKVSQWATQMLSKLDTHVGDLSQIRAVTIKTIANSTIYEVVTARHGAILIDAESGELFRVTAKMAEVLVKRHMGTEPRELKMELLTRHEFSYPWGPLPVFRGSVAEEPATFYYVSATDGTVNRSDRESRLRNAIASLHTLDPIKLVVESDAFRKGLLIISGLIGLATVCTGLVLATRRLL